MDFYTGLLLGTVVTVIFILAIVGYCMYLAKGSQQYPPSIANCPDNYIIDISGNCIAPSSLTFPSDSENCAFHNFSNSPYIASGTNFDSGNCKKKIWAERCDVTWDGITNNGEICFT
jgi:hypothetical protein